MKTIGLNLLILANLFFAQMAKAAQIPDLPLSSSWYKTSIIIFSRPGISNANTAEMLFVDAIRKYPNNMQAFPFNAEQSDYFNPLSLRTSLSLTWPTLAMLDPILNQHLPDELEDPGKPMRLDPVDILVNMAVQPRDPLLVQEIVLEMAQDLVEGTQVDTVLLESRENEISLGEKSQTDLATADEQNVAPDELELALFAIAEYETQLQHSSLIPLAEDAHLLKEELRRLQARDDYRVLYSATWNQNVPERSKPTPILIQAGERKLGLFELEGSIAITLGRYLHANAELWLHDMNEIELLASANQQPGQQDIQWMQLSESRRMRSTELHYLDHPKFGVLIKIEPVEVPAQIDELWKKAHSPADAVEIDSEL